MLEKSLYNRLHKQVRNFKFIPTYLRMERACVRASVPMVAYGFNTLKSQFNIKLVLVFLPSYYFFNGCLLNMYCYVFAP